MFPRGYIGPHANLIGIDPEFVRNPSDGGDGWGDNPYTHDVDESANDDFGDLHLTARSPAVDYGNDVLAVDADGVPLATDRDGNPRNFGGSPVDVGAYEFQGSVAAGREDASLTVNTAEDVFDLHDGRVSLREAIYYATSGSPNESITFDGALDGATITLSGNTLWIDKGLTIDASPLSSLTIDADARSRVITVIASGEDLVELDGLTIANGSSDYGGGIHNSGVLTITNCTLSNNAASADGGGIHNGGTLTVDSSTLRGNSAVGGGGIRDTGTLTITNSTLSSNTANGASGHAYNTYGCGGGIYSDGGSAVTNCTLSDNAARDGGGGIYTWRELTVAGSVFWGNSAAGGGGISIYRGTLAVTNCTLAGNLALGNGGGIRRGVEGTTALNNTIVAGNTASAGGVDISQSSGTVTGSHNIIGDGSGQTDLVDGTDGNLVGTASAPIDPLLSDWSLFDDGRSGHYLLPGSPALGAGNNDLALDPTGQMLQEDICGNPRILDGTVDIGAVEGATAGKPARVYIVTSLENTIADDGVLTFAEAFEAANRNQPVGDAPAGSYSEQDVIQFTKRLGGTVVVDNGELRLRGDLAIEGPGAALLTFDAQGQNRVFSVEPGVSLALGGMTITGGSAERGGGICNYGDLTITNSTLFGNSATGSIREGGGVYNGGTLTLADGALSNNSASSGGAICNVGILSVVNSVLSENSANDGGGIFNSGTVTAVSSMFSGNSANDGGGIYSTGTVTAVSSILTGNVASYGGGICSDHGTLTITGGSFSGNSARHGGGIRNYFGTLAIANSTIAGNAASDRGGGIYSYGTESTLMLNNTILADNTASLSADLYRYSGTFTGSHNLIGDGSGDPLFIRNPSDGGDGWGDDPSTPDIDESANDDYGCLRLQADSAAVDAGDSGLIPADTHDLDDDGDLVEPVPFDLDGNARVVGEAVDIGAYEYFALAPIPGDLNDDYVVNSDDLNIIRANWGQTVSPGSLLDGDPSGDGKVTTADLDIVRANWGAAAPVAAVVVEEETTEGEGGEDAFGPTVVYGPREAADAAFRNWDRARLAWAEAVEGLVRERGERVSGRDVKTARRAAMVDLAVAGWEGRKG